MICNAVDESVMYAYKAADNTYQFAPVKGATADVRNFTWYVDRYDCSLTEEASPAISDFATLYGGGIIIFVLVAIMFILILKR